MKLVVQVIEARNIPAMDPNGFSDPYVKLQLGKQRFKTKVVKKCLNPSWCQDFTFKVDDMKEELVLCVMDEDKFSLDDFVGQVKIPISRVFDAIDKSLGTTWYPLQPKNKKSKNRDYSGDILLNICFQQNKSTKKSEPLTDLMKPSRDLSDSAIESLSSSCNSPVTSPPHMRLEDTASSREEKPQGQTFAGRIAQLFYKNDEVAPISAPRQVPPGPIVENINEIAINKASDTTNVDDSTSISFEEKMKTMESKDQGSEIPANLPGGIIIDQTYMVAPKDLNSLLFSPDSNFPQTVSELQETLDVKAGPWKFENNGETLKRGITFNKAASRFVRATRGIEEQIYLKADGKVFAVLDCTSTPDVPYGGTFKTELLYLITPGPELPSGEQSSKIVVSFRTNFLQSTMMKGMIEGGTAKALKENFEHFTNTLCKHYKTVDAKDVACGKDQVLATLEVEMQSDWKLATRYLFNFTMFSTLFMGIYVLVHIWLSPPGVIQGLEFVGLDLPDSIGEVVTCGILILQGERVLRFLSRFMQARAQKGTDHGIKARGDGWLLTVALVEGNNLAAVDSTGFSDPYVVFTCNGQTKTSSIKFQQINPQWNEIFEFDAMDEPPSMLDVDVYDFDGPFDEPVSLGHAEINFMKNNISDLADVTVPLLGKLAQPCQSKLQLRIFLDNTRGTSVVKEYLTKMEEVVGKKVRVRSHQTNSAFQKLFGFPPEEFLINDFACHLKRKSLTQGRLFLSARTIGFHADIFGRKTKFFFLWEDIEDIQVTNPTLSSMGSPIVVMTLRPGRGGDARHGAKSQDAQGRLKFYFHTFLFFGAAHKTIMALWKARALSPEQKVRIVDEDQSEPKSIEGVEEDSDGSSLQTEESGTFIVPEDVHMSLVHSSILSLPTSFFMELFIGGDLERKVMESAGCLTYSHSLWELDEDDRYQRQIYYKFDKNISRFRGEVTSMQQKSPLSDKPGWLIEEVMTLHGVPLSDYFNLQLRYQVEDIPNRPTVCNVQVYFGVAWLKKHRHQKKITKNILSSLQQRSKVIFGIIEKQYALEN